MRENDLSEGESVTVNYRPESTLMNENRRELTAEITDVTGEVVYLDNPFGEETPTLVLDNENYLWARDEQGRDGLFGSLARLE